MSPCRKYWIALSVVIILTTLFRAQYLRGPMLWTDEYFSLMFTTGHLDDPFPANEIVEDATDVTGLRDAKPIWQLPSAMRADTHPPLFPIALRLWREMFGSDELSARIFMILWAVIGAGMLFDAVFRQANVEAAGIAGVLYAGSTALVSYGFEIRNYGMMTTLIIACANAVVRVEQDGFNYRRGIAFGLCALGSLLTHYFALASIAALMVYTLFRIDKSSRIKLAGLIAGTAILFAIIQFPSFFAQQKRFETNLEWLSDTTGDVVINAPLRAFALLTKSLTFDTLPNRYAFWTSVAIVLLLVIGRSNAMRIWLAVLLAAILQCVLIDLIRGTQTTGFIRYALPAAPSLVAMLSLAMDRKFKSRRTMWVSIVIASFCGWATFIDFFRTQDNRPQWHQTYDPLRESAVNSSDTIVFIRHPRNPWYTKILYASYCAEIGPPIARVVILDDDKSIPLDSSGRLFVVSDPSESRSDLSGNRPILWKSDRHGRGRPVAKIEAYGPTP